MLNRINTPNRGAPLVLALTLMALLGVAVLAAPAEKDASKYTALDASAEPSFPAAVLPVAWGDVVGFASSGSPGHARDETILLMHDEEGTFRRVHFVGGKPTLTHVIRCGSAPEGVL